MLLRIFGCAFLSFALAPFAVDAGGAKKVDPPKVDPNKKTETKLEPKVEKKADEKREFDEKDALLGVVKSVDKTKSSVTLHMEKSKKDRTFGLTSKTEYFGPRGGDRNSTGIDDECLAPGYDVKVVPTKDGRNAAAVQFDVRKGEEKKAETKKDLKK